jgi:para-nitrobenzyl esterase
VADIPIVIGCTKNDIGIPEEGVADREKNAIYKAGIKFCEKLYGRKSPLYNYYFKRDLPGDDAGAFHTGEMWYVFGTLGRCWRPMEVRDFELSERMVTAWTDFAKSGNPGWDAYTPETVNTMDFDVRG